ncbi:MAG: GNAT family N-acetyltransferase [Solirubrobacterales bacterium]|nr:GNAT family N-acetyltransferase [Solirubrobacterales bacterium]
MPSFPLLSEPLAGRRVLVRDYAERDIPEILLAYQDDATLHLRMGEERPPSGAELGRWAESEAADRASGVRAALTVLEPGSDDCAGQLYVHHVDWDHRRAEIGIWLAPAARGRGLASDTLRLVGAWLLGHCGLERVQLLTEPDNEPMLRAAEAAGFVREGVLRAYLRERRTRVDVAILSLLPGDVRG